MKRQVDAYEPRRRIPSCQFLVKCTDRHVELEHKVVLQGAKDPYNFFTLDLVCAAELEGI